MGRIRDGFTSTGAAAGMLTLFLVTGGTAVAAPLIDSGDIKNHSITSADLKNGSVVGATIKDGTITGADVKNATITGADVVDNSLTGSDVKESSLGEVPKAGNARTVNGVATRVYERHVEPSQPAKTVTIFTGRSFKIDATCGPSATNGSHIDSALRMVITKDRVAYQWNRFGPNQGDSTSYWGEGNATDEENFLLLRGTSDGTEFGTILVSDEKHHATEVRWYSRVEALPGEGPLECSTDLFVTELA